VDEKFDAEAEMTMIKFGSDAYFKLLEKAPHLVEALKLGTKVVVTTAEGNVVAICGVGNEKMTDAQVAEVFVAKAEEVSSRTQERAKRSPGLPGGSFISRSRPPSCDRPPGPKGHETRA
jgi:hypothetical protein